MHGLRFINIILVIIGCLVILNGCGEKSITKYVKDTDSVESQEDAGDEAESEKDSELEEMKAVLHENPKAVSENVDMWIPLVLNHCNSDLIGGHSIDEGFLYWYISEYGEDALTPITEEVLKDTQDPEVWYQTCGQSIHVLWNKYCECTGIEGYELENVEYKETASGDETVISFTGDINLGENMNTVEYMDLMENGIFDCLSEELVNLMTGSDIMMINNEFPYSTRGEPIPGKAYTFRADPTRVEVLNDLGVDIVSLANNHMCDYGDDAIIDTIDTLDNAGIAHVGAGKNIEEATEPYYYICNGRKISIVAATQIERTYNYTREATETTPGVLKTLNPSKFVEVIKNAKANSDICIVFVHWGTEGVYTYESDQVALAEAFVDAGADVIIGGHTHCLQGISYIEDVPIIYSLGNFWFSSTSTDGVARKETGVSQVKIKSDGSIDFLFLPCVQQDCKTYLVTDADEKQSIIDWMNAHSGIAHIDSDGLVSKLE
ncbi:MAG: CapA family protein [Lachnospiraceae bacterium]|nr:CapA family protein [Lachnospiraceae bacterium]